MSNYMKSTAECSVTTSQTVLNDGLITFNDINTTGSSIGVMNNNQGVILNNPGLYLVMVNAFGVESGTAGSVSLQLNANGTPIDNAIATAYSEDTTGIVNVAFSCIVNVLKSCECIDNTKKLTLSNVGIGATYGGVQMTVIKQA